jgi:hypothetical protein
MDVTPYGRHLEDMYRWDQEQREKESSRVRDAKYECRWEDRPLLCRLGIHLPNARGGIMANFHVWHRCLRCGYEWRQGFSSDMNPPPPAPPQTVRHRSSGLIVNPPRSILAAKPAINKNEFNR